MPSAQRIQTSASGARLHAIESPPYVRGIDTWFHGQSIVLEPAVRYQTWLGFGGALTESAAYALSHLEAEARDAVLRAYFHPTEGHGYRFARTHINSCDFSLGNWSCAQTSEDFELAHFSLERTHRYITPLVREAQAIDGAEFDLLATPWSPPGWMKTTGQMNHGGKLRPECRDAWALHYVKWVQGMREAGVETWGLSVQNEPAARQTWDSCEYSAEEERDFVRDHLGPALHRAGLSDVRLLVWDHNREVAFRRANTVLSDPTAAAYVWGTGLHWYSGDFFEQLDQLHRAYPDHHLLFTEGCWEGGVQLGQYDRGARYAHHIIGDMNHFCEGWIDWNIALDHTGGPNHVGNLCDAPVIVDTHHREVHYQTSYHYIGQFSRFIPRGSQRIGRSYLGGPLESTAFRRPDGTLVLVVMNPKSEPVTLRVLLGEGGFEAHLPGDSIQTWVIEL